MIRRWLGLILLTSPLLSSAAFGFGMSESLIVSASTATIVVGQTVALHVTAIRADGVVVDLTSGASGTFYTSTNPQVATIEPDGQLHAIGVGTALVRATNGDMNDPTREILTGSLTITVGPPGDSDADGLPDSFELANGLNPFSPLDAAIDADADGLTALQEYQHGTKMFDPDTDGDGLSDGFEIAAGTDPLVADQTLREDCVATVLNRSVMINRDGTFTLTNIPVDGTLLRVSVTCERNGTTLRGQSAFFLPQSGVSVPSGPITLGSFVPIPLRIGISAPTTTLTAPGQTVQMTVMGNFVNGSIADFTGRSTGTTYLSSNPAIATVQADPGGLVTAVSSGTAIISALNNGVLATIAVQVVLGVDADGDGLPDDYERANACLNVAAPDAGGDPDADGLTNAQEFSRGSDPCVADTDGDGIADGAEVALGSNPVLPDTDRDGVIDGAEPPGDADGDGLPNLLDSDSDNDGLPDGVEVRICGTITCASPQGDNDGDRLTNLDEVGLFTDPLKFDTDGDGLGDGDEVLRGTDPLVPDHTPPVVSLAAPAPGIPLVRGETAALSANATDDGRVVRVDFLADGVVVGSGTVAPFTATFSVPSDPSSIGIEAVATDTNHNTGRSGVTTFSLVNDPLTTVTGLVRDDLGAPAAGALARVRLPVTPVETGSAAITGGAATINPTTHVSTSPLSGTIEFVAGAKPLLDALVDLEPAGIADVTGTLALDLTGFDPSNPTRVNGVLTVTGATPSGLSITMQGPVKGVLPVTGQGPLETDLQVVTFDPGGFASAQPLAGLTASVRYEGTLQLQVTPGTANVTSADIGASLSESVQLDRSATTGSDGRFSMTRVPTIYGNLVVDAELQPPGRGALHGSSAPALPVRGGTTDVGTIALGEPPPYALFPYAVYLVGRDPVSVTSGDFNRDGIVDFAAANPSSNDVSVLLGNADGTYGAQTRLSAPFRPYSVAAVDLNGDGRLDLVSANFDSANVSIFLGNGDGTFQNGTAQTRVQVGLSGSPISIAAADLDGDGRQDLVTADRDSNAISVLLGRGDGSFRPEIRVPVAGGPRALALGDFNGDGRRDVAVVNVTTSEVAVLPGNADGTFGPEVRFAAGSGANAIAAGDLDGDGRPDLAVANYSADTVSTFLGNGNGTFGPGTVLPVGHSPVSVAIGDLNGGGLADLVVVNQASEDLSVLLGNGDGSFRAQTRFAAVSLPIGLVLADVDRNGRLDVVITNQGNNNVQVLVGKGDGTLIDQNRVPVFGFNVNPRSIGSGDFNSDGAADFAVAEQNANRVSFYLGNGDGTFRAPSYIGVGNTPLQLAVADLNHDGRPDVVVTNQNTDNISILLGNGDGTFTSSGFSLQPTGLPRPLTIADFNKDGNQDLAIGRQISGIDVFLGTGTGTFSFAGRAAGSIGSFISLAAGDVNGDGKTDLVFTDGGLGVMLGNGDGTFGAVSRVTAGVVVEWAAVGDFDRDGFADIAAANLNSNDVTISLSNGNGTFKPPVSYHVGEGQSPVYVTTADLNGDGKLDLVMTNGDTEGRASDDAVMLLGRGDGTFLPGPRLACGKTPMGMAPDDYNGDGRQDMAIVNRDSQSVSILLNLGP